MKITQRNLNILRKYSQRYSNLISDTDNLYGELCLALYKTFKKYRDKGEIVNDGNKLAAKICKLNTIDYLRRHGSYSRSGAHFRPKMVAMDSLEIDQVNTFSYSLAIDDELTVKKLISKLHEKEKKVIYDYFFMGKELTQIGKEMGVGRPRACGIKNKALEKMREKI